MGTWALLGYERLHARWLYVALAMLVAIGLDAEPPWSLPDHEMRIVLVEKRAGLATRAIGALRAAGAYDLGAHLLALCTGQRSRLANGTKADVVSATSGVLTRPYDDISLQ